MPSEAKKKQQQKKKEAAKARQQNAPKTATAPASAPKPRVPEQKKLDPTDDGKENGVNGSEDAALLAEGEYS